MAETENSGYDPKRDFQRPSNTVDYSLPISDIEKEILRACQPHDEASVYTYLHEVERAKVKWACISSKTQRKEKKIYDINVYENLVEINHHFSGIENSEPPDRSESQLNNFSKKSRYRMMKKIKTMKKSDLNLPFFVTLTYHRNMTDFKGAKQNLNAFFQRFRRIANEEYLFRYFWKMEPQKRGAIHFHLMLFLPENIYPKGFQKNQKFKLEYARMRISAAWNEIAEPGDNKHLRAGTNVRAVHNWKMATGYLSKYLGKTVYSFCGKRLIDRKQLKKFGKKRGYRCFWFEFGNKDKPRYEYNHKQLSKPTGRFWGFSNNFDFKPYYRHTIDIEKKEEMDHLLKEICEASFQEFLQYVKNRKKELDVLKNSNPKRYYAQTEKLKNQLSKQRSRHVINLEKLEKGGSVQVELSQVVAREIVPEKYSI